MNTDLVISCEHEGNLVMSFDLIVLIEVISYSTKALMNGRIKRKPIYISHINSLRRT